MMHRKPDIIIAFVDDDGTEHPVDLTPIPPPPPPPPPPPWPVGSVVWVTTAISATRVQCRVVGNGNLVKRIDVDGHAYGDTRRAKWEQISAW